MIDRRGDAGEKRVVTVSRSTWPAGARRVVLVVPSLRMGGAERDAVSIAAYWADGGHQVSIVTWVAAADFFRVHPRVRRIRLAEPSGPLIRLGRVLRQWREGRTDRCGIPRGMAFHDRRPSAVSAARRWIGRGAAIEVIARHRLLGRGRGGYVWLLRTAFGLVRSLRRVLASVEPDVVVGLSTCGNLFAIAAAAGGPYRVVVSEGSDPARKPEDAGARALKTLLYPTAHAVTANTHGALASMRAYCPDEKLRFVPNPLILPQPQADGELPVDVGRQARTERRDAVLFLGRLEPEKGPDVLIDAFAQAAHGWRLEVAGDGSLGAALHQRVAALNLTAAVTFHGAVADPGSLLAACRIFALPSRYEGTPNALLEAMAHRLACVVSDASPGPLRLIEHGVTGLVVTTGSVASLADALVTLARDAALRARLGAAAYERVRDRGIDRVGPIWDRIVFPSEQPRP